MKKKYFLGWFFLVVSYLVQIVFAIVSKKYSMLAYYTVFFVLFTRPFYLYSFKNKRPYRSFFWTQLDWDVKDGQDWKNALIIFLDGSLIFCLSIMGWYFLLIELFYKNNT
jgi:hypothetical protein